MDVPLISMIDVTVADIRPGAENVGLMATDGALAAGHVRPEAWGVEC